MSIFSNYRFIISLLFIVILIGVLSVENVLPSQSDYDQSKDDLLSNCLIDSKSEQSLYYKPIGHCDTIFRMGPVMLKFDEEWVIKSDDKKYIKIGIAMKGTDPDELSSDYEYISPKSIATQTSEETIVLERDKKRECEITTYLIPANENKIWIDLYISIASEYRQNDKKTEIYFTFNKYVFFYHPTEKKWLGENYFDPGGLDRMLLSRIYDKGNDMDKIKEYFSKLKNDEVVAYESIINDRTLVLPTISFYNSTIKKLSDAGYAMFDWFVKKKESTPQDEHY